MSALTISGELGQRRFLRGGRGSLQTVIARRTEAFRQFVVMLLRVFPVTAVISAASRHMMMPSLSVDHGVPSKRRKEAPALSSPPKPKLPSNRPSTNHLKAHRHFHQLAAQIVHHAVNHRGGDQRFTHRHLFAPLRTMLEQVVDRYRQVVVRSSTRRGDNPVAVVIRVVSKRQIELIAQRQQAGHRTL